jgi:hypothetical protein
MSKETDGYPYITQETARELLEALKDMLFCYDVLDTRKAAYAVIAKAEGQDMTKGQVERQSDESARLLEALQRISRISNTDPFRTFHGMIQDMQMIDDISRAALRISEEA